MIVNHRDILANIKNFDQLIAYLRDEMGWPIESSDLEELTFDYTPEELGIDSKNAAKIESIKRLRPFSSRQPWGIFFIKFEPKRLPVVALRRILSKVSLKKRASSNSADRAAWAANDLLFISNYGEGDKRTITFAHFSHDDTKNTLPILKVLGWNYEDTALHLDGVASELTSKLAWPTNEHDASTWRKQWRSAFSVRHREVITTSKDLSIQLAKLAQTIRNRINKALIIETERGTLNKLMKVFKDALIHNLDADDFADMYAQTIAYGLLSARIANPQRGSTEDKKMQLPVTNPFLKELMETFLNVGGRREISDGSNMDFDELGVSEVIELLDEANMEAIILDFGDRNPQEDPVIHFYELFLKEYDVKKRLQRGVFYTPRPVVSYIVHSVDDHLRNEFGLTDGLADTTTWGEIVKDHKDLKVPHGISPNQAFVQILDPATGTGTFLVEAINIIHQTMKSKWKKQGFGDTESEALWNEYVPKHLLSRLHGYEIMMAPYAIAHLKIGLKLYETGYHFNSQERVRVFLTNSLEPGSKTDQLMLTDSFQAIAHEAQAVKEIKEKQRFTVIIGNPPYSDSVTENSWIMGHIACFKEGLQEQKSDLNREEWKFLRVAREFAGDDVPHLCCFIINNAFLRAITHRIMRKYFLGEYPRIDILNLHGSSRPPEYVPKSIQQDLGIGPTDQNVFEIMQGVTIVLLSKLTKTQRVSYSELWGSSKRKNNELLTLKTLNKQLDIITPKEPFFFLVKRDGGLDDEYGLWSKLGDLFKTSTSGIQTGRDAFASTITKQEMKERIDSISNGKEWNQIAPSVAQPIWSGFSLSSLRKESSLEKYIVEWLFNPFDVRFLLFHSKAVKRKRMPAMGAMLTGKIGLCTVRQIFSGPWQHVFVSRHPISDTCISNKSREYPYVFPSSYPKASLLGINTTSLSPLAMKYATSVLGATEKQASDDFVSYVYSVLHSATFRTKYREQLSVDFPRVPMTRDLDLARALTKIGYELVSMHLLESSKLDKPQTNLIGNDEFEVEKISWSSQTIWIDKARTIGFQGVPESVWNFRIGGYRVCEKWLKARRGRTLSLGELAKYQKIVFALDETIRCMYEIDETIDQHGGWPEAFHIRQDTLSASQKGLPDF